MNIEEEKKLVAEKLMGWEVLYSMSDRHMEFFRPKTSAISPDGWNPQSERKWWDEIWDMMDASMWLRYESNLKFELNWGGMDSHYVYLFHTAKPEICWEVLLKTLKDVA